MSVIKNINSANVCTLGNKGVGLICAALDSLTKKDRKNSANYLVVPNNFVLSLSLSLVRSNLSHFFLLSYARNACCAIPVNKGLFGVSFDRFFVSLRKRNKK